MLSQVCMLVERTAKEIDVVVCYRTASLAYLCIIIYITSVLTHLPCVRHTGLSQSPEIHGFTVGICLYPLFGSIVARCLLLPFSMSFTWSKLFQFGALYRDISVAAVTQYFCLPVKSKKRRANIYKCNSVELAVPFVALFWGRSPFSQMNISHSRRVIQV